MLSEKLNILLVNADENLTRLINGILGSVNYQLTPFSGQAFPYSTVASQHFDLIVINDQKAGIASPEAFRQIRLVSPEAHIVLVKSDISDLEKWAEFNDLNIVPGDALAERLPVVLSHFYSQFSNRHLAHLLYWRLLKEALESASLFTAILDEKSRIVFLNRTAKQVLKISFEEEYALKFCDFMKEGEKVWKFLTGKFDNSKPGHITMELQLVDRNFSEFSFPVSVYRVKNDRNFYLVQGTCLTDKSRGTGSETETILNAFADSLANELLNPLNVIWGRLQLFQTNERLTEQDKHHIRLIEKQIQRINEVIARLVSFTSIKRDLVPQKIMLNEILKRLSILPSLKEHIQKSPPRLELRLGKEIPPLYGQIAHIELLFNMIIELILNLTPTNSKIIIETLSEESQDGDREKVTANFLIQNYMEVADQHLLKSTLQFAKNGKKKFALEITIVRFILDEYKIRHDLIDDSSSLILSLKFPGS